jgi:serine phosphatase RsbU (regulator of sigma subunit)
MNKLTVLWNRLSRNGLREDEGILDHREVIFLNKILIVAPLIILFFIPIEVFLNGFDVVPVELLFLVMMIIPSIMQRYRLFLLARLWCIFISHLFIVAAGVSVGKGTNNHLAMIPLLLFAMVLFETTRARVMMFGLSIIFYVTLMYLFTILPPYFTISEENRKNFSHIFYFVALLLTFLLGYYFLSINEDYEGLVHKQKESIEEKNKEITDSITYAKRIQLSIIPGEEEIKSHLPESFVLYLPKDIVSGDFYWTQTVDDLYFIAAADSTGHGVPGAMVSVICSSALNRSIVEYKLLQPGQILDKARELILETFVKSGSDVKDGMDISLLCIDKKNKKLSWSGANNPLWYFTNHEFHEIKANKQPVGKTDNPSPFTTHTIALQSPSNFYLFTDGFADQFGGPKGKKFKYSQLSALLNKNQHLSMDQQREELQTAFFNWKGSLEQVDDICIIGLRL